MTVLNLGVDFGSTYSSFATFNRATGSVDLCRPTHSESEAIPSVACFDDNNLIITGHEARGQIRDDDDTKSFEAFKMLLTETDDTILHERGYTETYTPQYISRVFIEQQISKILTARNEAEIDNMFICVPEVWTTQKSVGEGSLDRRYILRDICDSIPEIKKVDVVSEPAAASAYFVHCFKEKTGYQMSGSVLIIDYGGGTLDLTITQVKPNPKDPNAVEIKVIDRAGEGENKSGQIGDAGIAYMEEVVRLAITESKSVDEDNPSQLVIKDPMFRKAYNTLERKLKAQTNVGANATAAAESYKLYNAVQNDIDDISRLGENHTVFTIIRYGKVKVSVTYSHLWRAYESIIYQKLNACLDEIAHKLDDAVIDYRNSNNDQFHVVIAGGFGKFIFVQHQVKEYFEASETGDERFKYDLGENREFAVAMGAALLAEKVVTIKRTAPFSIGMLTRKKGTKEYMPRFAINFNQEVSFDQDYWLCDDSGPIKFMNAASSVTSFLIGHDLRGKEQHELCIKPELVELIEASYARLIKSYSKQFPEIANLGFEHNIGFHMDEHEVYTLLIRCIRKNE